MREKEERVCDNTPILIRSSVARLYLSIDKDNATHCLHTHGIKLEQNGSISKIYGVLLQPQLRLEVE